MKRAAIVTFVTILGALGACSSPQDRAAKAQQSSYEAQEEAVRQRLELVEKYQDCVRDSAGDNLKIEACDSYPKAAEALR